MYMYIGMYSVPVRSTRYGQHRAKCLDSPRLSISGPFFLSQLGRPVSNVYAGFLEYTGRICSVSLFHRQTIHAVKSRWLGQLRAGQKAELPKPHPTPLLQRAFFDCCYYYSPSPDGCEHRRRDKVACLPALLACLGGEGIPFFLSFVLQTGVVLPLPRESATKRGRGPRQQAGPTGGRTGKHRSRPRAGGPNSNSTTMQMHPATSPNEPFPSPETAASLASATTSHRQGNFSISYRKLPISKAASINAMETRLRIPVPEMIFGDNVASVTHVPSGWAVAFRAVDALDLVDKTGNNMLRVAYAGAWSQSRELSSAAGISEGWCGPTTGATRPRTAAPRLPPAAWPCGPAVRPSRWSCSAAATPSCSTTRSCSTRASWTTTASRC